jgi:hypothetical protein
VDLSPPGPAEADAAAPAQRCKLGQGQVREVDVVLWRQQRVAVRMGRLVSSLALPGLWRRRVVVRRSGVGVLRVRTQLTAEPGGDLVRGCLLRQL